MIEAKDLRIGNLTTEGEILGIPNGIDGEELTIKY